MRAQALKKDHVIPGEEPEPTDFRREAVYTQRMFDCKGLPRLLSKEEMSCNVATD